MRKMMIGAALLLCSAPLLAQGGMGGGMGGGGMGGMGGGPPGGGGGPPGGGEGRPQKPREMKPIKRSQIDRIVTAMFAEADSNRDGIVTIDELRLVVQARREAIIRTRFDAIDNNHDGTLSLAEFQAWQSSMGSVALSETGAMGDQGGPVAEAIMPKLGDDPEDAILGRLIEPLNASAIAQANSNYDAGASLEEVLAFEHARFDAADADHDGVLSAEEMRSLMPRRGPGGGPGGPGGPGGAGGPPPRN
ncbi:EF-hand domain-containing protein [Sphingobium sp. DN12]|uniref:EF-hand domain-containing protein n=1 Tax=Sphingobium sp. DN12 TaxID=3378073 RepID=UPI003DA3B351